MYYIQRTAPHRDGAVFTFVSILASFASLIGSSAFAMTIDDFTKGSTTVTVEPRKFPEPFVQRELDRNTVLNGSRIIEINGVQGGSGNITATVDTDSGRFVYDATAAFPTLGNGLIEYVSIGFGDPNWQNETSLFSADLTTDGSSALAIDVLPSKIVGRSGQTTQSFSVLIASGDPGERIENVAGVFEVYSHCESQTVVLPFTDAPSSIDFTRVAFIRIRAVNLQAGTSFSFGSIETR